MTGELPRTTSGTPSYTYAKALVSEKLNATLYALMAEYGLTDLEAADILSGITREFIGHAVRDQQKRRKNRDGVIGTPRSDYVTDPGRHNGGL